MKFSSGFGICFFLQEILSFVNDRSTNGTVDLKIQPKSHPPLILVLHSELLLAWFEYQFLWSISDSYILISSNLSLLYTALKSNSDRREQYQSFQSYSVRSRWVNPCRVTSLCNHLRPDFTMSLSVHSSFVSSGIFHFMGRCQYRAY